MAEATIDSLKLEVSSSSDTASKGLDALTRSLRKLQKATGKGLGLTAVVSELKAANTSISSSLNGFDRAVDTLTKLGGVKISSSIGNQITAISTALQGADFSQSETKLASLNTALSSLSNLPKSNLASYVTNLKKLPEVLNAIDDNMIAELTTKVTKLAAALKPLGDEMQKVANGFSAFPAKIQKLITNTNSLTAANNKASTSYINLYAKIKMAATAIKGIATKIASWITLSSNYTETMNLFTVSMGQYAEEAYNYAQTVSEAMGIDPAEWMGAQGTLMTLVKGFGVAGDRANVMSQQLTQLGYDLSSFFNITVEDAMTKLESGIAGELEPLRRLGYDLSQAKLEAVALSLGIDKAVSSMTQAEKAELRYYAIMTQVTDAHGDMARTLNAPANQMRVLNAQVTQLGRALGNFFIPLLNKVLPYIIASVKVLREVLDVFMDLLGIELANVDFGSDSITGATGDVVENLEDAQDEAKKLKSYMLGFDELNVINSDDGSALDDLFGTGFDFELPTYNFMEGIVEQQVDRIMEKMRPAIQWVEDHLDDIKDVVVAIGAGFLAWKFANGFTSMIDAIKNGGLNKVAMGITLIVTGVTLAIQGGYDIGYEGVTKENLMKTLIGDALIVGGSLLTFGTGPLGWAIGIGAALTVTIASIALGVSDRLIDEDLAKRFGEYVLSDAEIAELAAQITDVPIKGSIALYLDEVNVKNDVKSKLDSAINELNSLNYKISLGIKVSGDTYVTAIDNFVLNAEKYLQQQQIVSTVAIDVIFGDSDTGKRLSNFVDSFYADHYNELKTLGEQLKQCVTEGFVDGVWIEDKLQEAKDLQKEIQEILDYISTVEFEAKIEALKLDTEGTKLTVGSFEDLLADCQSIIETNLSNLKAIRLDAIKVAKMEFDQNILNGMSKEAAQQIYDAAVAAADKAFREGRLELSFGTMDFGIDVITQAYADEIAKTIPLIQQSTQDLFVSGTMLVLPEDTYENVTDLMMQLQDAYTFGFADLDIDSAARRTLEGCLAALSPTKEEYEKIAADALKAGQSVPENISQGLNDFAKLAAISGDIDAINYMIGLHLSTDSSFLDMLATCKGAGEDINDAIAKGLLNNLDIKVNANGTITLINDTIGEKVLEITPKLVENMKALGYDISEGLKQGVSDKVNADEPKYKNIWERIGTTFKTVFDIRSPSKVFAEYGGYLVEGLYQGIKNGLGDIGRWCDKNVVQPFERAMDGALTFAVDVRNNAAAWWKSVKDWWAEKVGSVEKFTTNVKDNSSTWWNNVTTWWKADSKNGVDLKVYAEKGWTGTLKKALGIADSFDLSFKLPKIKVKWGEKEVLGFKISFPSGFETYAQGGFPEQGQMFIAREAGAELVGNIGGRTAVMNNDQIVESVSAGVYQAVLAALGGNNEDDGNTNIVINLDGEKIYENQQKIARGRGYNLGMGAFSFG